MIPTAAILPSPLPPPSGPDLPETARLQAILASVKDALLLLDPDTGAIHQVNRRLEEMTGLDAEALRQATLGSLGLGLWPCTPEMAAEHLRTAREGPVSFEWLSRIQDGQLKWLAFDLAPADLGGPARILATVRDISERKRAEMEHAARLRAAEAQDAVSLALAGVGPRYQEAMELIAHHLSARMGDLCVLDLLDGEGRLVPVVVAQPYLDGGPLLPPLEALEPLAPGTPGPAQVAARGEALRLADAEPEAVAALLRAPFGPYQGDCI